MAKRRKYNKDTDDQIVIKAILKKYKKEYNITPIIATLYVGNNKVRFAAVTREHIQVFHYDHFIKHLDSIATYQFKDYTDVTIDHFVIKSIFKFKGPKGPLELIPTLSGKGIEKIIAEYTSIKIHKVKRKWYQRIWGFRSNSKVKKTIASAFYGFLAFIILLLLFVDTEEPKTKKEATPITRTESEREERVPKVEKQPTETSTDSTNETIEATKQPEVVEEAPKQETTAPAPKVNITYSNCDEVKAAGKAPIHADEPGYSKKLDRDGDGIACDR
ncbi:excalibur calcium-binding domain-containing protein [Bacillus luti]|uniref:excalibur calcium-binding domain-containing protein n=1 Tax=Bacillus luti TaxID=2026191 RepID=UPI00289AAE01|nr:excalibur calcium-binding domain-containing protein [Bacillus luti]